MAIPGIEFNVQRPLSARGPSTRADVAFFAGLVARRPGPPPDRVVSALARAGWREGGSFPVSAGRILTLLGIPVAVESWAEFTALFDWRSRPLVSGAGQRIPCALGLAVRQFFLQGGARAWIVRCGDPLPLSDAKADPDAFRKRQLEALAGRADPALDAQPILPGFRDLSPDADPLDSSTWRGAALAYAVDDAAMLLLPDLPDIAAGPAETIEQPPEPPGPPEQFRPLASFSAPAAGKRDAVPQYGAARLDLAGYLLWSAAIRHALDMLGRPRGPEHRRDVMLVSALPIPDTEAGLPHGSEQGPLAFLGEEGTAGTGAGTLALLDSEAIGNARLQLAYPWLSTPDAAACPEGLQSPEGALAGLIARTSLERGAFRSAAGEALASGATLVPKLSGSDIARGLAGRADWLGDRLCLFAERRGRIELLSDSTAAQDRAWRKGGISRLVGILLRACRQIGDELIFEPAGPLLWARAASAVTGVLEQLRDAGAFSGPGAQDSYRVTCDRSTMTDADVDAGRVRCEVIVNPASPIERIVVTLSLVEPVRSLAQEAA